MNITDILRFKGTDVVTVTPATSVGDVVAELAEHKIGALVVTDEGRIAGIVSERDIVGHLHRLGPAVLDATVADVMTADVVVCASGDPVDRVAETMTERRVRHMPVVDDGALVGIVSIGDVVLSRIRGLEQDRSQLERYITG